MESEPQLIDLREFLGVVSRRKWSVALVVLVVMATAGTLIYMRKPVYSSTTRVEVRPQYVDLRSLPADVFVNMDTESARVTSLEVSSAAATALLNAKPSSGQIDALINQVKVSVPARTTYLDNTFTDRLRAAAQAGAEAFANAYIAYRFDSAKKAHDAVVKGLTDQLADPSTSAADRATIEVQLAQVPPLSRDAAVLARPANPPTSPSNKHYISTLALALILGLALGVGLAFVRERLDEHIGNHEQMEEAMGAPVFAVIPKVDAWRNRAEARLVSVRSPDSIAAEAYRTARTSIQYLARDGGMRVIEITGPGQNEGKTTTTVNLAVSLAQSGKRVIAVSCDLRKPRLHRFFGVDNAIGLTSFLRGQASLEQAMLQTEIKGLQIITSGPVPSNPAELLGSDRMDGLLAVLRERADFVLMDTTPALAVADALALAPKSDGVIIVADAAQTTRAAVSRLRQQFEGVGATIIGGILNNMDPAHAKRYPGYSHYYYSYGRAQTDRPQVRGSLRAQEPPSGNGQRLPESAPVERSEG